MSEYNDALRMVPANVVAHTKLGDTLANIRTKADRADVPDKNGHSVFSGYRNVFEIA